MPNVFAVCIRVSSHTTIQQLYPIKQMPTNGSYDIGERGREGSSCGLIEVQASLRQIRNVS